MNEKIKKILKIAMIVIAPIGFLFGFYLSIVYT
jgi:hypothetical protein